MREKKNHNSVPSQPSSPLTSSENHESNPPFASTTPPNPQPKKQDSFERKAAKIASAEGDTGHRVIPSPPPVPGKVNHVERPAGSPPPPPPVKSDILELTEQYEIIETISKKEQRRRSKEAKSKALEEARSRSRQTQQDLFVQQMEAHLSKVTPSESHAPKTKQKTKTSDTKTPQKEPVTATPATKTTQASTKQLDSDQHKGTTSQQARTVAPKQQTSPSPQKPPELSKQNAPTIEAPAQEGKVLRKSGAMPQQQSTSKADIAVPHDTKTPIEKTPDQQVTSPEHREAVAAPAQDSVVVKQAPDSSSTSSKQEMMPTPPQQATKPMQEETQHPNTSKAPYSDTKQAAPYADLPAATQQEEHIHQATENISQDYIATPPETLQPSSQQDAHRADYAPDASAELTIQTETIDEPTLAAPPIQHDTQQSVPQTTEYPHNTAPMPPQPSGTNKAQVTFALAVEEHVIWLETDGREGRRANFSNMNFTGIDFNGANLQQANLRGAILDNLDLRGALLRDADMTEASLDGINASGADWSGVHIASASLQHAMLDDINLRQANAINANFFRSSMKSAILDEVNLRDSSLMETDLSNASLLHTGLREVDATDTIFQDANLTMADMRDVSCVRTDFTNAILTETSFKNAHFDNVSFTVTDFTVAHDIPMEGQNQGIILEKETIAQEKDELMRMQSEMRVKREEMQNMHTHIEQQRVLVTSLTEGEDEYLGGMKKLKSGLTIIRNIWIGLSLLLLAAVGVTLISLDVGTLKTRELAVVLAVPTVILLLLCFTLGLVDGALKRMEQHVTIREKKMNSVKQHGTSSQPYANNASAPTGDASTIYQQNHGMI